MSITQSEIVLAGQGKWIRLIAEGLREYANLDVGVAALDSVSDALIPQTWYALLRAEVVVRVGFRPGARTWRGRIADAAMRLIRFLHPGQRTAYYWIGTDLLNLVGECNRGVQPRWLARELGNSSHAAITSELATRICAFGIECAVLVHTPSNFPGVGETCPPMPADFRVLTYLPAGRQDFYDAPTILEAARRLPEVRFQVVGSDGPNGPAPPNVTYLGWREDISSLVAHSACVIRMVMHDGMGGTALEGLAYGRPVVYSRKYDQCIFVPFGDVDGLTASLEGLQRSHEGGSLTPDTATALRIRELYAPTNCYPRYADWLKTIARGYRSHRER